MIILFTIVGGIKFEFEKGDYEEIMTKSGKQLKLQCYRIFR